jgi:hypothetical protein
MRRDRDSFFMFICLIPAMYLVYAFFTWEATGTWPLSVPNVNLPAIPVPSFLHPVQQQSPELHHLINQLSANWFTISVGTIGGLLFGIILIGVLADVTKAVLGIGRQPIPVMDDEGESLLPEPPAGESA